MTRFKRKADSLPLFFKLILWFMAFALIMLILLWIFQTVFLPSFYKRVRINQVENCASSIEENITDKEITSYIDTLRDQNDVQVYVFNTTSSSIEPLYSTDRNFMQIFISDKKADTKDKKKKESYKVFDKDKIVEGFKINTYYDNAKNNGGKALQYIEKKDKKTANHEKFSGDMPPMESINTDLMVYTTVFSDSNNTEYMVLLTGRITPVDSIVTTIRYQLVVVTAILLVIGIILALLASKKISKPIKNTTENAKKLADKNYDVNFNSTGYLEVTELNKTLTYTTEELKKVESLQRELIANISHDLRTPLTMITGYGEVMRDLPGENTPENIQIIIDEANRLNILVTDLLDISKLQAGATVINAESFSITQLIKESFQRYNKLKEQEGYSLTFDYEENVSVSADKSKISQVFYNLVNNAINYSRNDKRIEVRQIVNNSKVIIEVEDHGEGIDQQNLENIWDRYYKVDKEHKSSVIGTGLGLSIVKNILDKHNARYGVRSKIGEGSTFWFELDIE